MNLHQGSRLTGLSLFVRSLRLLARPAPTAAGSRPAASPEARAAASPEVRSPLIDKHYDPSSHLSP